MGIEYVRDGHVATLTIDRAAALNALHTGLLRELDAALARVAAEGPRCLVVTGAGRRAFVAGADVAEMATMTRAQAQAFGELGSGVFRRLEQLPMPTIAAVNGYALGGGCELALACDLRLAATNAVFAQPEVGLGIPPGFGGTQRLPRLIGPGAAAELLFSGRRVDAARALQLGLVNSVHEPDELLPAALALAAEIAAQAPIGVRAAKQALQQGLAGSLAAGLALEVELFAACFETADQREAMAAFTEKRPAEPFRDA